MHFCLMMCCELDSDMVDDYERQYKERWSYEMWIPFIAFEF